MARSAPGATVGTNSAVRGFGSSIAAGDVNGDGVTDLLVGATESDASRRLAGAVFGFLGPIDRRAWSTDEASFALYGETADALFGQGLAVADFDGDGLDDLMVASPGGDGSPWRQGLIYVFRGPYTPGAWTGAATADVIYRDDAEPPLAQLGSALDACDLDGDGAEELVIGSPGWPGEEYGAADHAGRMMVLEWAHTGAR